MCWKLGAECILHASGSGYYEHGADRRGYRNGYRLGRVKSAANELTERLWSDYEAFARRPSIFPVSALAIGHRHEAAPLEPLPGPHQPSQRETRGCQISPLQRRGGEQDEAGGGEHEPIVSTQRIDKPPPEGGR